ncbi:MAG TPA: methionine--tRNA ligase [Gemmatimonadales bacterium]|nr:methionine--tRNA ligase [Gemmatimonadales bacterium]
MSDDTRAGSESGGRRFYLTTAIDYANGEPHFGHALEKIGADAVARYRRLRGDDVHFLIGMDEHGQKVAQAAQERGIAPQALVDELAEAFKAMWARLGISYDQFIRTSDAAHEAGVRALIERIFARRPDDFYERGYEGWYCVGCETFKRDDEIVDGKCVLHPTRTLAWSAERNWFFRLSTYAPFLQRLLQERPDFLQPESRRNEILGLFERGLEDIPVSRARLAWAIPFPRKTADGEQQGTWVWFDALPNYLTATGYPGDGYERRWPAQLHIIGKDITRHHCAVWPAMLEAAGLPLPERVWAHGFIGFGGERFSKSAGVRLDLGTAIDRHGPDALRYFLLREIPFDGDGDFSLERFDERYVAELADAFGNLASRVLAMLERYRGGAVPASGESTTLDRAGEAALSRYAQTMDALLLHRGAAAAWDLVSEANAFVERQAPWSQAKSGDAAALDSTLAALARCLVRLAVLAGPFVPTAAGTLWQALGLDGSHGAGQAWELASRPSVAGAATHKIPPLFPKLEKVTA